MTTLTKKYILLFYNLPFVVSPLSMILDAISLIIHCRKDRNQYLTPRDRGFQDEFQNEPLTWH
jgi:hypothetical protein